MDRRTGGVAERTKAAVLKTANGYPPFVGSNPTPSAIRFSYNKALDTLWSSKALAHQKGQSF